MERALTLSWLLMISILDQDQQTTPALAYAAKRMYRKSLGTKSRQREMFKLKQEEDK